MRVLDREAFEHYFGEYPFKKDGYKLIEAAYSGMEHQSAVTYGNRFANGYLERDWTGVGISPRFNFIIVHESGHEWFGNSVSAADRSDMWIHEGWSTYLECLYVEYMSGHDDYLRYTNGYRSKVKNQRSIVAPAASTPPRRQPSTSKARSSCTRSAASWATRNSSGRCSATSTRLSSTGTS